MTALKDNKSKTIAKIVKLTKAEGYQFDNLCDKSEQYLTKYLQVVNALQNTSRS